MFLKNNKSKKKNKYSKIYLFMFVCLCFIFGKTLLNQNAEKNKLNAKIEELKINKDQLANEIDGIKKDIQDKDSEEFVVKIARDKLKMVKKNEIIVKYKN